MGVQRPRPDPSLNPFPRRGTAAAEPANGTMSIDQTADEPTLVVPGGPVARARALVADYLTRYSLAAGQGQFVLLRGPHGAGKTHALRHLYHQVAAGGLAAPTGSQPPLQLYVEFDAPSFLRGYSRLIGRVSVDELRDLCARYRAAAAGEEYGEEHRDPAAGRAVADKFRAAPPAGGEALFQKFMVDPTAVEARQAREMVVLADRDFQRVLGFVLDPKLGDAAVAWLTTRDVSDADLARLGVPARVDTDDRAAVAFRVLARLCRRAGRPLLCYFDQFELLTLAGDPQTEKTNAERIAGLLKAITGENGLLALAGSDKGWDALPRHVQERFGYNVVRFSLLSVGDARDLIRVYLSRGGSYAHPATDAELAPFDAEAVREMVGPDGGCSPRRLLQLCALAYDGSDEGRRRVRAEDVVRLSAEADLDPDERQVADAVRAVLLSRGHAFRSDYRDGDLAADFAVLGRDGAPSGSSRSTAPSSTPTRSSTRGRCSDSRAGSATAGSGPD